MLLAGLQPLSADMLLRADQAQNELFQFNFRHQSNIPLNVLSDKGDAQETLEMDNLLEKSHLPTRFQQYDAIFSYPLGAPDLNVDLGVTVRHLRGWSAVVSGDAQQFEATLPLLHASAFFNLPYNGLSARLEGSHLLREDSRVMDYRAKLSYEWTKGFGLEGGWQHQQFNLDSGTEKGTDFENKGPFVDFYLRF